MVLLRLVSCMVEWTNHETCPPRHTSLPFKTPKCISMEPFLLNHKKFAAVSFWTHLFFKRMFLAELLWFLVVDWPIVGWSVLYVLRCFVLLCFGVLSFVVTIQFWSDLSESFFAELEITASFKRPTRHSRGAEILAYRTIQYSYPSQN